MIVNKQGKGITYNDCLPEIEKKKENKIKLKTQQKEIKNTLFNLVRHTKNIKITTKAL